MSRRVYRNLIGLAILAALFLLLFAGLRALFDPVLDRAISFPADNTSPLYLVQLEVIAPVAGKKVLFPPGLLDYLTQEQLNVPSTLSLMVTKVRKSTLRDYLDQCQRVTGLVWKYEPTQDVLIFDFAWHQPVSRPGPELVNQLGRTSPVPMASLPAKPKPEPDPWRVALNELMSEPENFPHAWKVRLQDGTSTMFSLSPSVFLGNDVFSQILKDAEGREHLLVLNYHPALFTHGPDPSIAFYLFAADGKWEDGGVFEAGTIWSPPTITFEPENKRGVIEIIFKPIVFTDMTTGKTTTLDSSYHTGDTWDYFLEIGNGRLKASLHKNGRLLTPSEYEMGVTPLRRFEG